MTGEREVLTAEQANELVGDDIAYWLANPFMSPDLLTAKVCHWLTVAATESIVDIATPAPVTGETTDADECDCGADGGVGCWCCTEDCDDDCMADHRGEQ